MPHVTLFSVVAGFSPDLGGDLVPPLRRLPHDRGFRYRHEPGVDRWNASHTEGNGVSLAAYVDLEDAAVTSQAAFDTEASSALGTWYDNKSTSVKALLRDVTRRISTVNLRMVTEEAGISPAATMSDFAALEQAAAADDREAFDDAAEAAWGTWYTQLDPVDADLVYQIVIDFSSAG